MARATSHHSKDHGNISKALEKALRHIRSLPDSHHKATEMLSLALTPAMRKGLHFKSRFRNTALEALREANRIAKATKDARIASYTYGYLG